MELEPTIAAAAAAAPRARSARWVFTVNNPDDWTPLWRPAAMAYLVWQYEKGEVGGTVHIQGYVRFTARKDLRAAKNTLNRQDAHMEVAHGTEQQCHDYCTKAETRYREGEVHGELKPDEGKQGRRSDLEAATDRIKKGAAMKEIAEEFPSDFVRYHAGFQAFADAVRPSPPLSRSLEILVLWGESGQGKTHRAMEILPTAYVVVGCGRDPFGMYSGQLDLIVDEFQPDEWKLPLLLRMLDKWKQPLDCRYRDRFAAWTRVVICTNLTPDSWYTNRLLYTEAQTNALRRRVNGCCRNVTSRDTCVSALPNEPRWPELADGFLPTSLTAPQAVPSPAPPVYDMDD